MGNHKQFRGVEKRDLSPCYCWWILVFLLIVMATLFTDTNGQTVTVTMNDAQSNVSTNTATMRCEFGINDNTYALRNLVWRKGGATLAHFFSGAADATYLDFCQTTSPSPCTITRDSSSSQFVLSPVDFNRDNGDDYECQLTYIKGADSLANSATAGLTVIKPTNNPKMLNGSSSDMFEPDKPAYLSLKVNIFQCVVADINPQASFTWTVGSMVLQEGITESHVVDTGTGLTTSTSNATLTPDFDYNGEDLICKAVNYEGDPGVMFRLVLEVEDQCMDVDCKNGGTCVPDTSDPSDPGKPKCNCTKGFTGDFCKEGSSAERISFRIEMIFIQCLAWMAFKLMYI